MSIRNLDELFKPRSIALVGNHEDRASVGAVVARNLLRGEFAGPIMPVDPHRRAVEGVLAYPTPASLPEVPDLVVIAMPPAAIPELIAVFGERGTRAAVVVATASGDGGGADGEAWHRRTLEAAARTGIRIVGPNSIGVMVPATGLNAGVAPLRPRAGRIAFVTQSATVTTSILDWATSRGIGFSHVVSLGDMWDVDLGDMLDYLASEPEVRGVVLYVEAVTHARKFMSAARALARLKPIVVIKAGRYPASASAVVSHTGALAGQDAVYDAAFRRAGMLRVNDIGDLFGAVETLATNRPPEGRRLAILANGGGIGVMATDALLSCGGRLAELGEETIRALDKVLPRGWSRANPVDILNDASGDRYASALQILLKDDGADAVLVLKCPTALCPGEEAARSVIGAHAGSKRSLLTCWLGEDEPRKARTLFTAAGVPTYFTPERAARAFVDLFSWRQNQETLMQTPPSIPEAFVPDITAARAVIAGALAEGREWLTEPEAKAVLEAYHVPVVPARTAADPRAAAVAAASLAGPVALKILSRDIQHKSDVGGVVLDLRSPAAVRDAAEAMYERVRAQAPDARIDGFIVQPMFDRPEAFELIVGAREDPQFGPVVLFGHGGTAAQIVGDTALALPPLNMHLAREAMARTRIFGLLVGFRGRPPAAVDEIALTLIKVAQLIVDNPDVVELDINPLVADEFGVLALDARLRVREAGPAGDRRLAIRPYPTQLEERLSLPDGRNLLLRPVRPEDEPAFQDLFAQMSPEDIRMRFFAPKKSLTHPFAARLTQIDYDREMALVLADPGRAGQSTVYGVVHIAADPDNERAEYAIMLRSDMSGLGLGPLLMRRIIDYGRARGLREIFGEVLRENRPMLRVCERLGFVRRAHEDDPGLMEVRLML